MLFPSKQFVGIGELLTREMFVRKKSIYEKRREMKFIQHDKYVKFF